jgi:uncharacterized 2Fe-2S/4Fe-4S cluster protein (DUF4445 family)
MNHELIDLDAGDSATDSLTDLLALRGHPLNARCGQRGLCRGCMVDLLEGSLIDASGNAVTGGESIRSCQMRLPPKGRVLVRIHSQARTNRAMQVGETFFIDVPCGIEPSIAADPGRDTAFAIDVGTTTVAVMLVDLATGAILARAGDFNAQIRFGDNVITRIGSASSSSKRLEMRRALVEETLVPLLKAACDRAGRAISRLAGGTVAGNTTMLHILADEDPTSLGIAPFTARFLEGRTLNSGDIGLGGTMPIRLLPGLSAYIGADITAGVHSTGMTLDEAPSLLVDMGTNGEIVLSTNHRLIGCATAAGPAFEGSGLSCGTLAQDGAASVLRFSLDPFLLEIETIGAKLPPAGICGSAYIDFLATARSCGLLRENGRFDRSRWSDLPTRHHCESEDGLHFLLAGKEGPAISEIDIAHLLQAKAAIGAGIETLLTVAGLTAPEIGRVYLAGGFGMHVDVAHAIAIGLLPGFRPEQVRVVGNTSLAGAFLALMDRTVLAEMEALRGRIEVIELNQHPEFENGYIDHLSLP